MIASAEVAASTRRLHASRGNIYHIYLRQCEGDAITCSPCTAPSRDKGRAAEMKMYECDLRGQLCLLPSFSFSFSHCRGGRSFCTSNSSLAATESRTFSTLPPPFVFIFAAFRLILPLPLLWRSLERSGWNRLVDTLFT